jgi:hypothetical protein
VAGFGPYVPSEFFGPGDALKIGIGAGESSGGRSKLLEIRMDPSRLRVNMIWQLLCEVLDGMAFFPVLKKSGQEWTDKKYDAVSPRA